MNPPVPSPRDLEPGKARETWRTVQIGSDIGRYRHALVQGDLGAEINARQIGGRERTVDDEVEAGGRDEGWIDGPVRQEIVPPCGPRPPLERAPPRHPL